MSTTLKACLAVAFFLGAILGGVVFVLSHEQSSRVFRLFGIWTLMLTFASVWLGASALADYIYGPRSK